jgi:uncharacterized protein YjbJ (UPF0337 family)
LSGRNTCHRLGSNHSDSDIKTWCQAVASKIRVQEVFMKDQVRGKAEEIKGKVTGNRGEEMKGKARQIVGNVKRDVRDLKGDVTSRSAGKSKPT